ncbi:TANFOR domain-containing protein [Tannerella forsythia]|uniref:TANFOR domain-containing protein n=1 Tax=Tannerella forsythia TaxID=28112 RepID=UPI0028DC22EF|nr:TANFOR domain-containing protein [Tannerella forsythia]
MCSHSKKQSILRRLLFAVFTAIAALSNLNAQNYQIKQTVQVLPPYTDKLSDYFASPGKIVSIITTTGISMTDDYLYYLHGYIENTDNAGIWIGTDPGITPHPVYMQKTPGVGFAPYTLTYSELQQIFSEQTLKYQGITREQVQQNGLPAGSYRICFRLFIKTGWMNQFEEASRSCSAPFRIEKKAAIVDQTVQVLPPYTNKLSDYFESPGKIQSVIFVTQYPDNQALFNVRGMLEQVDGNVRIGSGQFKTSVRIDGTPSGNNVSFPPYTLTHTNYREMFREPMVYQGITRDQVQRDGLPEGNYRICFVLSNARTDEEIGLFCSASFRIQKKEAIVNQTVQVLPPYTNKLSDYLESPGKIQSVITVTQYPDNQADLDMTGTLEQVDGNIRIGSGQNMASVRITGTPSGNNVIFPPYTVTHNDYRNVFREPMVYQGITREQVQRNGLPEGTYRLCFQLRKSHSAVVIGSYCSAPFQIRKKNAVVNQAVMVMPPYTNKLSDYFESPGKIRNVITIAQYPDDYATLRVQGTLESTDGKIVIGSAQHAASVQIKGTPSGNQTIFTPYTLTYNELRDIFKEPMNYQGITREQVLRDGLPDGSYRLCFKVYDAKRNQLLSQACSPPFMVAPPMQSALEPPQLIQPYDGSELPPEQKQTVQFTWTMPPGAPATTQYMIKIIELNDRYANYRDMLRNSSYPAFFETTVRSVPTYLYTPANPAFKEGKTYAWVVRAIGNNVNTPAAIVPGVTFKNDGYSEPAVFTFKKSKEVKVEPPKKETPPIVSEEGLKIFVPGCRNCNENFEGLTNNVPEGGSTYYLQGHTLNPNLLSGPNAGADPKGRKPANSDAKTDLGGTSLASGSGTKIEIPADAIAVNNARNFYLRWEDKSSLLAKRQPKPGEGIIYRLQIREAASEHLVWEKDVWERNSYEQTKKGLPFVDGQKYVLYIAAMRGVVTPNGFSAVIDAKGKPDVLASSCQCEFTYMELDDVSDLVEYTVKGKLLYKFEHHPEKYPLTTTTATLTRYTRLIDAKTGKPSPICPKMPTPNDDRHSVPVKINDDGTFEATIYARPDGGLIEKDQEIAGIAGPGARGDLYEFFNLELNSPYYTLGKKEERLSKTEVNLSDKTVDLGEITYNVWSYTLEVEVSKGYKGSDNKVTGTYRELNPPNVNGQVKRVMFGLEGYEDMPYYEGDILPSQPKGPYGKNLITEGKVEIREGSDGKEHTYVTFDRLICNFQYNDHYHVFIEQKLEENGKKKTYYTNEFSCTEKYLDFKYVPTGTEQMQAEKDDHSNFFVKRQAVLLDDRPPRSTVKGRLVFADPCVDESQRKPMANTDIALVVTYLVKDKKGNEVVMNCEDIVESCANNKSGENSPVSSMKGEEVPASHLIEGVLDKLKDRNKILAVTRTDADGNFEFKDFARIDSTFTQEGYKEETPHSFYTGVKIDGTLRATVRVVVNNAMKRRWLNPSKDIEIQPNSTMDVGELKAYVDSYILRVKPIGDPKRNDIDMHNKTLQGAWVEIARDKTYDSEAAGQNVVERKRVELKEGVDFSVPRHNSFAINDLHIMTFTSDSSGEHAFETDKIFYPGDYNEREYLSRRSLRDERATAACDETWHHYYYIDLYHFTSSFKRSVCEVPIVMTPKNPIVSGRLLDSENLGRGVDGTVDLLRREYNPGTGEAFDGFSRLQKRETSASNHGYFVFDNLGIKRKIDFPNPAEREYSNKKQEIFKKKYSKRYYSATSDEELGEILEEFKEDVEKQLGPRPPFIISKEVQNEYALDPFARGYSLLRAREQKGLKDTADVELNHRSSLFPATGFTLKMGQQMHFPQILMEPNGKITGYVVAEEGLDGTPEQPQKADVRSTRSRLIETKQKDSKEEFTVRVPTLQAKNADTLFILPRNLYYYPDTVPLPGLTDQSNTLDLGKRVVKERRHRIRIKVGKLSEKDLEALRKKTGISGFAGRIMGDMVERMSGIPGITVKIKAPDVEPVVTNDQGIAEFEFTNAGKNFSYELIPPENSEYIASSGELTNHESKEMTPYYYQMRKGATVSGRVTSNGEPVPGAKVWVMNGDNKRQVTADDDGRYTLRGIKAIGDSDNNSSAQKLSSSKNVRKTQNESRLPSGGKYYATIHCGAPDDNEEYANLLGKDTETAFDAFDGRATVDFDLDIFYKANISTLHGFKVTVTDVQEDGGDNYRITGTIQLDKTPGQFGKKDGISQNPEFKDLKVRVNNSEKDAKGRPYFEVPGEAFSIGMKLMNVELKRDKHTYHVQLVNAGDAFLNIAKDGLTGGLIRSKARIEPESFSFSSTNFTFENDQFYLSEAGDGQPNGLVTSFKSYVSEEKMNAWKAEAESEQEYRLHNADRKPLRFEFVTFNATSPINRSLLGTDGVIRLKPDVWLINPLFKPFNRNDTIRIDLPEVAITPGKIEGDVNLDKIDVKFENWTIEAQNCVVDASKGGISSNKAVIRTGTLDLWATAFVLNKDVFKLEGFDPDKIPLGKNKNVSQIDITPGVEFQLVADKRCGSDRSAHLKLSLIGDPAGSIKNLPGFDRPLGFQTISLLSNGESIISFAPDCKALRLYDVVDFHPLTINSYDDGFNLDGTIDFGIPEFPTSVNYKLMFTKQSRGKELELNILPSNLQFVNVGTFKSLMERKDEQIIKKGLVKLHGTIEEEGALAPIRVVVWKKRTPSGNYRIWMDLEDRDKPKQSICLGGGSPGSGDAEFRIEKAGMIVDSQKNKWDFLSLKLVPAEGYGDKSGFGTDPLYFVLSGALRTETDIDREERLIRIKTDDPDKEGDAWRTTTDIDFKKQQIKMAGTDRDPQQEGVPQDGFMDFVLTYDHPNRQLVGDMTITEKNIAGAKFSGALHMVVGRPGFYFMGAGEFSVPVIGNIKGGMIFGYYEQKIPQDVWASILQYSARGEVPCCFTGDSFKGFYAMGAMSIPGVPRIDYEVDLEVASFKFLFEVGAEAAFWGSFQSGRNEIGVSAMVYANLMAAGSIPCCTLGVGAKATIKGYATMLFNRPYTLTLGVCGDLTASGCIKVGNPLSFCKTSLYKGTKSKSAHVNVKASVNLSNPLGSPNLDFKIGWGTCGGSSKVNCPIEVEKEGSPCD